MTGPARPSGSLSSCGVTFMPSVNGMIRLSPIRSGAGLSGPMSSAWPAWGSAEFSYTAGSGHQRGWTGYRAFSGRTFQESSPFIRMILS